MIADQVILVAVGALALLWWSNRRKADSESAVSVTGASVNVSNVEAIEERFAWQYSGPAGFLRQAEWNRVPGGRFETFRLSPGTWYGDKPALPGNNGMGQSDFYKADGSRYDFQSAEWNASWSRDVLTVGQQLAMGSIIAVPLNYTSQAVIP